MTLPVINGKTPLVNDANTFAAMKEILQLLRTVYDDEASKQIKEKIESDEVPTQWYEIARPPYPGECKTDIRTTFAEPPVFPPNINPKDFTKGWTNVQ
jgi:hypothetical protein